MTPDTTASPPISAYAPPSPARRDAPSVVAAPSPIPEDERIVTIDVVRGFALWGVCLANLVPWFSGYDMLSEPARRALPTWPADRVTEALLNAFVHARFITIFSFLFGLGFAVQFLRAEARGANATKLLARRLAAMLVLGLAHAFLVWYGDILNIYAITGVVLLVARRWPVRRLLAAGVALAVLQPVVHAGYARLAPALTGPLVTVTAPNGSGAPNARPSPPQTRAQLAAQAANERFDSVRTQVIPKLVTRRSYAAVVEANRRTFVAFATSPGTGSFYAELAGLFLLGLCVGRSGVLRALDSHRDRWRLAFGWSATFALIGYLPRLGLQLADVKPDRVPQDVVGMMRTMRLIGQPAMSMAYVCGLVLLMQRPAWRRVLLVLAPVGRMALTNYLTQSFLAIAIFYGIGFGLFGHVGATIQVAMSAAIIGAQAVLSRWWLARYRFGPAEWLWRTMTYGRLQPMRVSR